MLVGAAVMAWAAAGALAPSGRSVRVVAAAASERPVRGLPGAPVAIEVFGGFAGPANAALARALKRLLEEQGEAVRVVFRQLPGRSDADARAIAEIAEEAFAQGRFWPFWDEAHARGGSLRADDALRVAAIAGLDMARLHRAIDAGAHRAAIDADERLARRRGIGGRPSVLVDGRLIASASYEALAGAVDDALARQAGAPADDARTAGASRAEPPIRRAALRLGGAPSRGPDAARVVVVEFGDLAAPEHAHAAAIVAQLRRDLPDAVRHVFKHLPRDADGLAAHEVAVEAARQGRFWELYERLALRATPALGQGRAALGERLARAAKLDAAAVAAALSTAAHRATVERDLAEARALGLSGRALFVNGRRFDGRPDYARVRAAVEEELQAGLLRALR